MTQTIDNSEDIIDSRDVIARIDELTDKRTAIEDAKAELADLPEDADEDEREAAQEAIDDAEADFDEDEREELAALEELVSEAEGYAPDWRYGATLIRDSYFVDYCEQMVVDIGDLPNDIPGYLVIDWEKTADNLRADYTSVDFDGVTYWVR